MCIYELLAVVYGTWECIWSPLGYLTGIQVSSVRACQLVMDVSLFYPCVYLYPAWNHGTSNLIHSLNLALTHYLPLSDNSLFLPVAPLPPLLFPSSHLHPLLTFSSTTSRNTKGYISDTTVMSSSGNDKGYTYTGSGTNSQVLSSP